ncbi:MAG: 50S ribosomal protein L31 [Candidatus Dadabacteria bacterium]|nr:MAG: 50S ribosomal protein L31 [Candidatus Dadabacteria bacterium]
MREGIHPDLYEAEVTCGGCGTTFKVASTVKKITVNVCSKCHPFYTGKHRIIDTEGRVEKFLKKYKKFKK